MKHDILKLEKSDAQNVYNILKKETNEPKLFDDIKNHIRHELAYKMVIDGKIEALMLAKNFKTHYSLSYYIIDEKRRKKMTSLFFFLFCFKKMDGLPIYIKANKNISDYERYFENCGDGVYRFTGLREDASWAELLKR